MIKTLFSSFNLLCLKLLLKFVLKLKKNGESVSKAYMLLITIVFISEKFDIF